MCVCACGVDWESDHLPLSLGKMNKKTSSSIPVKLNVATGLMVTSQGKRMTSQGRG